jgi:hypothetical protein
MRVLVVDQVIDDLEVCEVLILAMPLLKARLDQLL